MNSVLVFVLSMAKQHSDLSPTTFSLDLKYAYGHYLMIQKRPRFSSLAAFNLWLKIFMYWIFLMALTTLIASSTFVHFLVIACAVDFRKMLFISKLFIPFTTLMILQNFIFKGYTVIDIVTFVAYIKGKNEFPAVSVRLC